MCLVSLADFKKFISDDKGKLIKHIFESNVRDYQGKTQVNDQIQSTLQASSGEDFWWLNNGVTVLATNATQSGKALSIENPEIVNGLQTSTEIYNYFASANPQDEKRNVLVRVIVPNAAESRDRIIRATNSQTAIKQASLRATDTIHRNIEQYLFPFNYYYDRRKNYYKNEGRPIRRIISISQLAQALEAVLLQRPDTARARPSSLIKEDDDHEKLFSLDYPIAIYLACTELVKEIENYLADVHADLNAATRHNIKYYLVMVISQLLTKKLNPSVSDIASLAGEKLELADLDVGYQIVYDSYVKFGASDQAAKGAEMLADILKKIPAHI